MPLSLEVARTQPLSYEDYDSNADEKEEEALSLCDLPIAAGSDNNQGNEGKSKTGENDDLDFDFDFDFGSLIGPITKLESEMCAADEVFSGGQMLPFRHSVSSENTNRSFTRSESIETGFGSRSSSSRSHQSSASSSTTSSSSFSYSSKNPNVMIISKSKPKTLNQLHSSPRPKLHIRASGARLSTSTPTPVIKSTMWQVLRLGLVRAPEIELQGRTSLPYNKTSSRNSCSSNNRGTINKDAVIGSKIGDLLLEMQRKNTQLSDDKISSGGIFKSCKCSVGAIEPLPTRVKSDFNQNKPIAKQRLNEDKAMAQKKRQQQQHKQIRQGKEAMSRNRAFEWLRDLSHSSVLNS